jgi:hypothetical protein
MVLDQRYPRAVLKRKDGGSRRLRWHRQFDDYSQVAFIAGEEAGQSAPQAPAANTVFAE